jgi:hypothetical protein
MLMIFFLLIKKMVMNILYITNGHLITKIILNVDLGSMEEDFFYVVVCFCGDLEIGNILVLC